jgi:hypothetical protein
MKRSALAFVVTGALALAACGGSAESGKDATAPQKVVTGDPSDDGGVSTGNALARAAVSTTDAGSAHMTMTITMSLPGAGDVAIAADGVSDFANGNSRMTMDMGALFSKLPMSVAPGAGSDFAVEMRVVDGTIYVHYPEALAQFMGGKPWLSISGGDELKQLGSNSFGPLGQADPRQYLEYLATVSSGVEQVGNEKIAGVDTTKYHAVVQFDKALDQVPQSTLDQLGIDEQALAAQLDAMHGVVGSEMPVDVWIDNDGRLRRMRMDMSVAGEKMSVEMNLDQYGIPVDVAAPPADEVTDMRSMLGNLSGGNTPNGSYGGGSSGFGTGSGTA